MGDERQQYRRRIEAALERAERAAGRLSKGAANAALEHRYSQLRAATEAAVSELDRLIIVGEKPGQMSGEPVDG